MVKNNKLILVVEDDVFLSDIYQNQLQKEGFDTMVAANGQAALDAIKEKCPNLITLDMIMPGMNGFDFLEILRQDKKYAKIPVVILTNLSQEIDKKRCQDLRECSYFVKTEISIDEVIKKIKEQIL